MVKFLATENAYSNIVDIIKEAKSKVFLISPYIKISDQLFARLKYFDRPGMKIVVVCRGKDLNDEEKSKLRQLKCLELRFDEDLHAKCFYNEKAMVVTSMNLYEYSQRNNREMGFLIRLNEDPEVFEDARIEAEYIVCNAKKDSTVRNLVKGIVKEAKSVVDSFNEDTRERTKTPRRAKTTRRTKREGYCIRCGENKTYDPNAPYCPKCFRKWNKWHNPNYKEHICHGCGKEIISTLNNPMCRTCEKTHN